MSALIIAFPGAKPMPVGALPIDVMLSTIPSLPRPILARLTARMIDRMDELDGDADLEPEEDRCAAGEDMMIGGPVAGLEWWDRYNAAIGSEDDAEPNFNQEDVYD